MEFGGSFPLSNFPGSRDSSAWQEHPSMRAGGGVGLGGSQRPTATLKPATSVFSTCPLPSLYGPCSVRGVDRTEHSLHNRRRWAEGGGDVCYIGVGAGVGFSTPLCFVLEPHLGELPHPSAFALGPFLCLMVTPGFKRGGGSEAPRRPGFPPPHSGSVHAPPSFFLLGEGVHPITELTRSGGLGASSSAS